MKQSKPTMMYRRNLVKIGKELGTLNDDDVVYIMDTHHTEFQIDNRMTTARKRSMEADYQADLHFRTPYSI